MENLNTATARLFDEALTKSLNTSQDMVALQTALASDFAHRMAKSLGRDATVQDLGKAIDIVGDLFKRARLDQDVRDKAGNVVKHQFAARKAIAEHVYGNFVMSMEPRMHAKVDALNVAARDKEMGIERSMKSDKISNRFAHEALDMQPPTVKTKG